MNINQGLRLVAGVMILVSLLLTYFVHANWVYFTMFIAANLIQSAFTNWCPLMTIMRKMGVQD
ncbi:DUF2892 domain-containing protein [uncultured Paraglaciecola sp.]|jgi:glucan phosphoethanolaminetransferase (alkaline phosphatase superfamily)|uniref:YgaP family membrane protein n=1 Tax=uncultured Paraglaciecola sp. TaxID=1765024 RepID=UPI002611872E|nr:DUF2892 domain-containing protein [uncultured Paraglaciecola sp.]